MKRLVLVLLVVGLLVVFVTPAFAHLTGPCAPNEDPGHSGYARHHIVPLAQAGALGAGGHIPGTHQGFSDCDPAANHP